MVFNFISMEHDRIYNQIVTLGNCGFDLINEFRIYSKELNLSDIQSLIYR
jgi:hypothetical protein